MAGLFTLVYQRRQFHEQRRLTWVDRQLNELYSPIVVLCAQHNAEVMQCVIPIVIAPDIELPNGMRLLPGVPIALYRRRKVELMSKIEKLITENYALAEHETRFYFEGWIGQCRLEEKRAKKEISDDEYFKLDHKQAQAN